MTAGDWGVLAWLVVVPILVVLLASGIGLLGCLFLDWRASRREQRRLQRAFDEAYGYRHRPADARGAYPLTPMPPESPARRQLREWQERLDARDSPETPTPAEMERLLTPFPPMPVPAPRYTPPNSPRGMARRSAR